MMDWQKYLDTLPEHMRSGISDYVERGIPPGGFLTSVLCNDLKGAFMRADEMNKRHMNEWAQFMYFYMPSVCQGSLDKVTDWIERGGLMGASAANKPDDDADI